MPRFVILRHDPGHQFHRVNHPHFDWMFEHNETLLTWSSPVCDDLVDWLLGAPPTLDLSLEATKIANHRTAYLDYEGEVSGGRGHVRRLGFGEYEIKRPWKAAPDCDSERHDLRLRLSLPNNLTLQANLTLEPIKTHEDLRPSPLRDPPPNSASSKTTGSTSTQSEAWKMHIASIKSPLR